MDSSIDSSVGSSVGRAALAEPSGQALQQAMPGATVVGTVYFSTDDLK